MLKKYLIPLCLIPLFLSADIKETMVQDIEVIKQTFEAHYAPKEWKQSYAQWNLDEQITNAITRIHTIENITIKDYQRIVRDFFNSTLDYHVGVQFYSTELALLPFRIHGTQGRYFIAWGEEGLEVGDEVLEFDGRPTHDVIQEIKATEFGDPNSLTDQALAETTLTRRSGIQGLIIPSGPVTVTVRRKGTDMIETLAFEWSYYPEKISNPFIKKPYHAQSLREHPFFYKDMSTPLYKFLSDHQSVIGEEKSILPPLGEVIWTSSEGHPFDAYIYTNESGKSIGFIRIPTYLCGEWEADKFFEIIQMFEGRTDALVIEQLNNPGGNMFYMYGLASMLTDRPLLVIPHRQMITQEDVFFAHLHIEDLEDIEDDEDALDEFGDSLWGYPISYEIIEQFKHHFQFLIDQWEIGNTFTEPNYMYGVDYIQPHPRGSYTKPILFLVNHLDFSCADFMPAILQDNHRATILGTQTSGAGGYVVSHHFPNVLGIAGFHYTGSIAYRANNNPIENLGITPDITIEMTPRDLEEEYVEYLEVVNKAVSDLLK